MSTRNMAVTSWPNLVQWQPPDGSRLASEFLVGTDAIILFLITRAGKKRRYYTLLVYKLFLQRTYSDTQVSLRFKNTLFCTPMYTCHLWWNYTAWSFHKLNVAFNNAFRMMHSMHTYCSPSEMFTVNRVADCKAVVRNLVHRFMRR